MYHVFFFTADMNDAQVRMALRQAFLTVEKGFFQSIDDALAEKTEIQLQLPEVQDAIQCLVKSVHCNFINFEVKIWDSTGTNVAKFDIELNLDLNLQN